MAASGSWAPKRLSNGIVVTSLLLIQAALLAYSATRHSPTDLEPAFLASGLAQLEFGRFEPYRVNPPMPRMIAALPVWFAGYKADWSRFLDDAGARSEFALGDSFVIANGPRTIWLLNLARWACIPFSLLGAYFAYRWAKELYGAASSYVALVIFVFEPNLLAHGELVTPDAACIGFGIMAGYAYWRWLKQPTWTRAFLAGTALGLAELSKMSWLILFAIWPILWAIWRACLWRESANGKPLHQDSGPTNPPTTLASKLYDVQHDATPPEATVVEPSIKATHLAENAAAAESRFAQPPLKQLVFVLMIGVYLINLGYAFDGTGTEIRDLTFVSRALTGEKESGMPGNRFQDTWVGELPIPLPKQFILGFDSQKKDFERYHHESYLRGIWRDHGWWYYYFYGLLVKVPCGLWALFGYVLISRAISRTRTVAIRDELTLLLPGVALLALVSSQTAFSIHLRYVFPSLALVLIYVSQSGETISRSRPFQSGVVMSSIGYAVLSALLVYPNHLAYFNDFVGGPAHGEEHILGSSMDWGQGQHDALAWIKRHHPSACVNLSLFSNTFAKMMMDYDQWTEADASRCQVRLRLYSADSFSRTRTKAKQQPRDIDEEEVLKRFPNGSVVVLCKGK